MRVNFSNMCDFSKQIAKLIGSAALVSGAMLLTPPASAQAAGPSVIQSVEPVQVAPDAKERSDKALKDKKRDEGTVPEGLGRAPVGTAEPNPTMKVDPSLQTEKEGDESGALFTTLEAVEAIGVDEISDPNVYNGINSGSNPPDTVGDIGPNHYVQMTNPGTFQVFGRDGTPTATGPVSFGSLWPETVAFPGADPCTVDRGDPIVVYDHLADRWLLMQFSWQTTIGNDPQPPFYLCFALSTGPNPTPETAAGTWYLWTINVNTVFPDYPKLGVWPDAYYMTTFEGGNLGVFALDRANMLNGNALQLIKFTTSSLPPNAGVRETRILPADLNGATPPAGTPGLLLRTVDDTQDTGDADDRIELFEFVADFANPPASSFTSVQELDGADGLIDFALLTCDRYSTGATNAFRDCIPVPGAGSVDALSNRPMMQLGYRNFGTHEAMTVNQTVDVTPALNALAVGLGFPVVGETAGLRWYELRRNSGDTDWSINQQGTYAAQNNPANEGEILHRWMGSASMDRFGNIALGYSISSDDVVDPGIRYAGRIPSDPLGLLPQSEYTIFDGTTSPGGTGTRWGDYSAMSVDPVDDCTFWFTTHLSGGEAVRTQIANFRFNGCSADLEVSKSANPSPAIAGEQITYTIDVVNNGPLDATGVVVTDTLPAGFSYVADSVPAPECDVAGQDVTCEIADIDAGDNDSFTITALIESGILDPGGPTTFDNFVMVAGAEGDNDETNNSFTLSTLVNELADLAVFKTCKPDASSPSGGNAFCEIDVRNFGPSDARNVMLDDQISSNGAYTVTSILPEQGSCSATGPNVDVSCDLGTIAAGDVVKVTVNFTSPDMVDVNDVATVSSDTPDPNTANNTATGSVSFTAQADLSLEKIASVSPATPGMPLDYTLTVTNNGPSTASNVVIRDVVPAGLQITGITPSAGASCVIGVPGNAALPSSCSFGPLAPSLSRSMVIATTVLSDTQGVLNNNGVATSDTADPDTSNNNASVSVPVTPVADIAVAKFATKDPVTAGDLFSYVVTVSNNGPSDAVTVSMTDTLPVEVDLVSFGANMGGICENPLDGVVTCDWAGIITGGSVTATIDVQVKADTPNGAVLANNVVAGSDTFDDNLANNSFDLNTDVEVGADLWMEKTGNFPAGNPSGTIIYRLTVHNEAGCTAEAPANCGDGGPSDALNVMVVDSLPLNPKKIIFEFATEGCTYSKAAHQVTCDFGAVPVGASVFADIQVRAKGSVGNILNSATLSSSTYDPEIANNTHTLLMTVGGGSGDPGGPGGGRGKGPKG